MLFLPLERTYWEDLLQQSCAIHKILDYTPHLTCPESKYYLLTHPPIINVGKQLSGRTIPM